MLIFGVKAGPNVPNVPPHISVEQMIKFTKAMAKKAPKAMGAITETFKDVVAEILTH